MADARTGSERGSVFASHLWGTLHAHSGQWPVGRSNRYDAGVAGSATRPNEPHASCVGRSARKPFMAYGVVLEAPTGRYSRGEPLKRMFLEFLVRIAFTGNGSPRTAGAD